MPTSVMNSTQRPRQLRVRLSAETASVPGARRFVSDGLAEWGRHALVEDAALCVTEMAANAALHSGSSFMNVLVQDLTGSVRVTVEDDGARVPVTAVRPGMTQPDSAGDPEPLPLAEQPTTGRGLAIVSMLAESWGIDEAPHGRRIWADLTGDEVTHEIRPPRVESWAASASQPGELPSDWKTVRLPGCPVPLGLRIDQHLDELVRELQLIDAHDDSSTSRRLAGVIERVLSRPAFARHTGRRSAQDAAAAGLDLVDIEMTMPRAVASDLEELSSALRAADHLCRDNELLTLAATPEMRSLRAWFTECMVGQLEHDAKPVTYAAWLGESTGDRER